MHSERESLRSPSVSLLAIKAEKENLAEGERRPNLLREISGGTSMNTDLQSGAGAAQQQDMEIANYMYVPPFDSLLKAIGLTRAEFERSTEVRIPTELFKLLLQIAIANSDFNTNGYLKTNPDVADAVRNRPIEDARIHYVGFGFFEGRGGATPDVDEAWYLRTYTDVADGVRAGQIELATEHFRVVGAAEGRSLSAAYILAAEQWKKALRRL